MKCFVLQGTHISFRNKQKEEKVDGLNVLKVLNIFRKKNML